MNYTPFVAALLAHIKEQYGAEPEFLWARNPNSAALRHSHNRKWFAALMLDLPRKTLGLPGEGRVDVLNVKCGPQMVGSLVDGQRILPGYHMNKEHWVTLLLDGSVPAEELYSLVGFSHALTAGKRGGKRTPL